MAEKWLPCFLWSENVNAGNLPAMPSRTILCIVINLFDSWPFIMQHWGTSYKSQNLSKETAITGKCQDGLHLWRKMQVRHCQSTEYTLFNSMYLMCVIYSFNTTNGSFHVHFYIPVDLGGGKCGARELCENVDNDIWAVCILKPFFVLLFTHDNFHTHPPPIPFFF